MRTCSDRKNLTLPQALSDLKKKGFQIEEYPSEWVLFLEFWSKSQLSDRHIIKNALDKIRPQLKEKFPMGQAAYSLSSQDLSFGMKEEEYLGLKIPKVTSNQLTRVFNIYLVDTISSSIAAYVANDLHKVFGDKINIVRVKNFTELRNEPKEKIDCVVSLLGIDPGDPLTHLSFLQEDSPLVLGAISLKEIEAVGMITDENKFNDAVKVLEKKLIENIIVVPFAHFPGVVVEAPGFKKMDHLSWGWGAQAWTYQTP